MKLAILGATAIVLGLAAVAPAFACNVTSLTTTVLCSTSSTSASGTACTKVSGIAQVPSGDYVQDEATTGYSDSGGGTITFYLVSGTAPTTCPSSVPEGATSEGSSSSSPAYSSVLTGLTVDTPYYFYVVYTAPSGGSFDGYTWGYFGGFSGFSSWFFGFGGFSGWYPSPTSSTTAYTCEPFTGTTGGSYFPPPSVPQFPLGLAALLAVAIPGLLVIKSRYSRKLSPATSTL